MVRKGLKLSRTAFLAILDSNNLTDTPASLNGTRPGAALSV